jgi:hypothetical protein
MRFQDLTGRMEVLRRDHEKERLGFTIGTLTNYDLDGDYYLTPVRKSSRLIYTGAIVRNVETAIQISRLVDETVSYIFVDSEKKVSESNYGANDVGNIEKAVSSSITSSTLLTYKGNDLTVQSADTLIRVLTPNLTGAKIAIAGVGNIGMKLALSLLERGNSIYLYSQDRSHSIDVATMLNKSKIRTTISRAYSAESFLEAVDQADVLIATSNRKKFIGLEHVNMMNRINDSVSPILVDVGKGCFKDEVNNENNTVMRVDVGDQLSSEIDSLVFQYEFLKSSIWSRTIGDTRFVIRGIVGKRGDVLVDSLSKPSSVLGICDGEGNVSNVTSEIEERLVKMVIASL